MERGGVYVETCYVCSECNVQALALIPFGEKDPWTSPLRPDGWQAYYCMEGLLTTILVCGGCRGKYDADGVPAKWRKKPRGM
jgi:hypothetical protein